MREIIKTFQRFDFKMWFFNSWIFEKFHSENFIWNISRETFGEITIIYLWKIKMLDDDILFFGSLNCLNISQQGEISRDGTHNTILNTVWILFCLISTGTGTVTFEFQWIIQQLNIGWFCNFWIMKNYLKLSKKVANQKQDWTYWKNLYRNTIWSVIITEMKTNPMGKFCSYKVICVSKRCKIGEFSTRFSLVNHESWLVKSNEQLYIFLRRVRL